MGGYNKMKAMTKFKKIGYSYLQDSQLVTCIKNFGYGIAYEISFVKDHKCIEITPYNYGKEHYFVRLDKETIEAINTQIKELKW